jgi:hypothetical protein
VKRITGESFVPESLILPQDNNRSSSGRPASRVTGKSKAPSKYSPFFP